MEIASAARSGINSVTLTAETTFAFSSVFIILLCVIYSIVQSDGYAKATTWAETNQTISTTQYKETLFKKTFVKIRLLSYNQVKRK